MKGPSPDASSGHSGGGFIRQTVTRSAVGFAFVRFQITGEEKINSNAIGIIWRVGFWGERRADESHE